MRFPKGTGEDLSYFKRESTKASWHFLLNKDLDFQETLLKL